MANSECFTFEAGLWLSNATTHIVSGGVRPCAQGEAAYWSTSCVVEMDATEGARDEAKPWADRHNASFVPQGGGGGGA